MNPLGQIGQQMADDSIEFVKDTASATVKAAAKAGTDIAAGTVEQITAPNSAGVQQGDTSMEKGHSVTDSNVVAQRKAADQKQLHAVQDQLAQYRRFKQQQDQKIAQEKNTEEQEKKKEEGMEKQKSQNWVQKLLNKGSGAAHGETAKQKE